MYESLGNTTKERQENYRELFSYELSLGLMNEIRNATNGNFVLGDNRFKEEIGKMLGRRVKPRKAGRPVKNKN